MQVTPTPLRMTNLDPTWTYPVRAPQTHHSSYRGNFTNPHFSFPVHEHSFIHSFIHSSIHSSHTSKHCICNCCITTLRVASRSGRRLTRYERRPIEVRRLAHKRHEAASHQTEPTVKNLDEPQRPCLTPLRSKQGHLDLSCSILTSCQAYRISIEERPAGHLSRDAD